jgi:hypothetical protein
MCEALSPLVRSIVALHVFLLWPSLNRLEEGVIFYFNPFEKQFLQIDPRKTFSIYEPDCRVSRWLAPLVHRRVPLSLAPWSVDMAAQPVPRWTGGCHLHWHPWTTVRH